jgi:hypothetical protein
MLMTAALSPGPLIGAAVTAWNSYSYGERKVAASCLSDSVRSGLNEGIPVAIVLSVVADREGCRVRTNWDPDELIGASTLVEGD